MGDEHGFGKDEAYTVNLKRVVARELDHDADLQSDTSRLNKAAVAFSERMLQVAGASVESFVNSMDERQKDTRHAGLRKEHNIEERMAELEETFNKNITATNEALSGIASMLAAAGVVGVGQQTSGETKY